MTTNAGAADLAKPAIGFVRNERNGEDEEAINRLFTPEFRNRLDSVIAFSNLSSEVVGKVVEKFIMQLEEQLADRRVTITLSKAAHNWLAKNGFDHNFGARPLGRLIQEKIKQPLSEELLFGKLSKGGSVTIGEKNGELTFLFESAPQKGKPGGSDKKGENKTPEFAE